MVRSGAALASVLLALGMMSALAVGGIYVARLQVASARAAIAGAPLQPAAERALVSVVSGWDTTARAIQAIASTAELSGEVARVWVTRVDERVYWLVAEASARGPALLTRRLGLLVSADSVGIRPVFPRSWTELPDIR